MRCISFTPPGMKQGKQPLTKRMQKATVSLLSMLGYTAHWSIPDGDACQIGLGYASPHHLTSVLIKECAQPVRIWEELRHVRVIVGLASDAANVLFQIPDAD
jgi:hypothetical protein